MLEVVYLCKLRCGGLLSGPRLVFSESLNEHHAMR